MFPLNGNSSVISVSAIHNSTTRYPSWSKWDGKSGVSLHRSSLGAKRIKHQSGVRKFTMPLPPSDSSLRDRSLLCQNEADSLAFGLLTPNRRVVHVPLAEKPLPKT